MNSCAGRGAPLEDLVTTTEFIDRYRWGEKEPFMQIERSEIRCATCDRTIARTDRDITPAT